jgi:methyl-accepting chemotaxis protein
MDVARIMLAGMWLQETDSISSGNSRLLMVFIGLVAVSMVIVAITVIIMAVGAAKTRKRVLEIAEEFREKGMPVITATHELIRDTAPKIKIITENLVETSHVVRSKAQDLDMTITEVNAKTRAQVARVDGMVTAVLDTTSEIAESIQRGIKVPIREVSGLVNGLKAGLDVLIGRVKSFPGGAKARVYSPVSGSEFTAADYRAADSTPRKDLNTY